MAHEQLQHALILSPNYLSTTGMMTPSAVGTRFTIVSQDGDQIHA